MNSALWVRGSGAAYGKWPTAEIAFTSLPAPAIFKAVALDADGIVEGQTVRILVDLSTVGSRAEQEVAEGLTAKGIDTVDAPVSGGVAGANDGTLALTAPGKPAAIERVRALFDVFGKVSLVGEQPGQGHLLKLLKLHKLLKLLKLLNNMISTCAFAITSEAFVAGVKGGLAASSEWSQICSSRCREKAPQGPRDEGL